MTQSAIFLPFFGMLLLTFVVWVVLYSRRIPFIKNNNIDLNNTNSNDWKDMQPAYVKTPADNFSNLFELPVLFYAIVLYLFTTKNVDGFYVVMAWIFFGFRCLHSLVHCTKNVVMVRFGFYAVASMALWLMILRAAWQLLGLLHE